MMRALLVLLMFAASASADCKIRVHVANINPGCCAWASLETIGRHLGYDETQGLAEWYVKQAPDYGQASPDYIETQLREFGIEHETCKTGDLEVLRRAARRGLPALIGFKSSSSLGAHACVFKHIDDRHVYFHDCNHGADTFQFDIEDFKEQSSGWFVVIEPK